MDIAPHDVPFAPDHQSDLAVDLEPHQSVDHMHAFAFQGLGPFDVALFIEPGLQLQQYRDLLPLFDGLEQGLDNGRVPAHAIERDFDRENVRIARSPPDEFHHRLEGFEGVVQEDISAADQREYILFRVGLQSRRRVGKERFVSEIRPVQRVQFPQSSQVQGTFNQVDVLVPEFELAGQDLENMRRDPGIHLQSNHGAKPAPPDSLFNRF